MALSSKKSRNITIDGILYSYIVSVSSYDLLLDEYAPINITIQNKHANGNKLFVQGLNTRSFWFDFPNPKQKGEYPIVTAKHIKTYLKRAKKEGYDSEGRGKDFILKI